MFLIDGHNLIGRTPGLSLSREEEGREALLRALGASANQGRRIVVVFDGNRPGAPQEERMGGVTVVYSPAGRSADEEILRRVGGGHGVTVVTSDRGLAQRAAWAGCNVVSCEDYRKRARRKTRRDVPEKPEAAGHDVEEWLKVFGDSGKGGRHKI